MRSGYGLAGSKASGSALAGGGPLCVTWIQLRCQKSFHHCSWAVRRLASAMRRASSSPRWVSASHADAVAGCFVWT